MSLGYILKSLEFLVSRSVQCEIQYSTDEFTPFGSNNLSMIIMYHPWGFYDRKHVTIHMIHFNIDNKIVENLFDLRTCDIKEDFKNIIRGSFLNNLDNNLILTPIGPDAMGPKCAQIYKPNQKDLISRFRKELYGNIIKHAEYDASEPTGPIDVSRINKRYPSKRDFYKVYCTKDGKPLYAIQDYFHGRGNWTPHISWIERNEVRGRCEDKKVPNQLKGRIKFSGLDKVRITIYSERCQKAKVIQGM